MNTLKNILSIVLVFRCVAMFAQQTPASKQSEAITIVGATAHIGDGTVINNSFIVIENGKITTCVDATANKMASKGRVINAAGKHVYPGFIATNSSLGLVEVNAVRASNDQDEIGDFIPHIRSLIAYNAESKVVESMRPNGVLTGQISPKGGRISGTSSIVQFDAWNWEDAAIKVDDGIHLNWPRSFTRGRWWLGEDPALKPNEKYNEQVDDLNSFIAESKAHASGNASAKSLPHKAMKGLFNGSQKLYVRVEDEKGITDAVNFKKNNGIQHMVIVGGYEAPKVVAMLKQHNIPVLVEHTHSLPNSDDHDYDYNFKLPKLLADAGILVGIQNGFASNFQARNLPFYAGQVVAQGMSKEDALKLITSNTAKILGIDKMVGTLEVGKDATLFISEGDALDYRTNNLSHAFIQGREISLETHQTELWQRYSNKYKN